MKQYNKSKQIKWDFKFWLWCSGKTRYWYHMDTDLDKKQTDKWRDSTKTNKGFNVWKEHLRFWNCLNIQKTISKTDNKNVKRGDLKFLCSKIVMAYKWTDNNSILLLSNFTCQCEWFIMSLKKTKRISNKFCYSLPYIFKAIYYNVTGKVDLTDQRPATNKFVSLFLSACFLEFNRYYLCQQFSQI